MRRQGLSTLAKATRRIFTGGATRRRRPRRRESRRCRRRAHAGRTAIKAERPNLSAMVVPRRSDDGGRVRGALASGSGGRRGAAAPPRGLEAPRRGRARRSDRASRGASRARRGYYVDRPSVPARHRRGGRPRLRERTGLPSDAAKPRHDEAPLARRPDRCSRATRGVARRRAPPSRDDERRARRRRPRFRTRGVEPTGGRPASVARDVCPRPSAPPPATRGGQRAARSRRAAPARRLASLTPRATPARRGVTRIRWLTT